MKANNGGGLWVKNSLSIMRNLLISNNYTNYDGAGFYFEQSTLLLSKQSYGTMMEIMERE